MRKKKTDTGDLERTEKPRRRAGLRPDELEPGRSDPDIVKPERHAAGTPGGGTASGGLGGTNRDDGAPEGVDLEDAMGSGNEEDK